MSRVARGQRYTARDLMREMEQVFDVGVSVGEAKKIDVAILRFLDGEQDPDLMTRKQLGDAALLLVKMAAKLTERQFAVPVEDYIVAQMSPRDREWYERCHRDDDDIDIALDDES